MNKSTENLCREGTKPTASELITAIETMCQQGNHGEVEQLYWLRGPILIAVALLSVAVSIAQSLSFLAIVQLSLLLLGFTLVIYDSARVGHDRLRVYLRTTLGSIVWDDVMYKFWHPDYDWWKVFVETFVGQASWMYILPSTSAQRVQLVQAALRVDEQEAQRILFAPGGYQRLLLPQAFVHWLDDDGKNNNNHRQPAEMVVVDATGVEEIGSVPSGSYSTESSAERDSPADEHEDAIVVGESLGRSRSKASAHPGSLTIEQNDVTDGPPSMSDTMKTIVIHTISDRIRDILSYAPDSKQVAAIGITAGAAMALQLRYSNRARKIAMGVLETSTMAGLSTIALGSAGLILAKTFGPGGTFPVDEANMMTYIAKVLQLRTSLRGLSASSKSNKECSMYRYNKVMVCAAVAVVLLAIRRQIQAKHTPLAVRR